MGRYYRPPPSWISAAAPDGRECAAVRVTAAHDGGIRRPRDLPLPALEDLYRDLHVTWLTGAARVALALTQKSALVKGALLCIWRNGQLAVSQNFQPVSEVGSVAVPWPSSTLPQPLPPADRYFFQSACIPTNRTADARTCCCGCCGCSCDRW